MLLVLSPGYNRCCAHTPPMVGDLSRITTLAVGFTERYVLAVTRPCQPVQRWQSACYCGRKLMGVRLGEKLGDGATNQRR
jgi:hypothetical protein